MFELYDLLKESKMLHYDTLYDHRNVITDRQYSLEQSIVFDVCSKQLSTCLANVNLCEQKIIYQVSTAKQSVSYLHSFWYF